MEKRLTRVKQGQMIAGVASGLARYFDIDVALVRLIFALLVLGDGAGVLIYLALWLALPLEDQDEAATWQDNVRVGADEMRQQAQRMGDGIYRSVGRGDSQTTLLLGSILVVAGVLLVLRNFVPWLGWGTLWPVALIVLGAALLWRR